MKLILTLNRLDDERSKVDVHMVVPMNWRSDERSK